ncbi:MAG: haloacid dehalogenase-like hydrolase [Deltaproteobacteria bacterium]|nr:haloacid dehalogenase-like hydrolase [Deltaproteobacteria bacterium]
MKQHPFTKNTIALIYDFDGTLSPKPMQEYTVLPKLGIPADKFWERVDKEAFDTRSEPMLVYMRLLIEEAEKAQVHISRDDFVTMGKQIEYFNGVKGWFDRINAYVANLGDGQVKLKHYIISAGIKEILEGVSIASQFKQIYASEYHYNHHDHATFPKLLITDTTKTQFVFRINKGKEDIREDINQHMPEIDRPIPFSNIIYIGDGLTDVPSMTLVKKERGHSVAVFNDNQGKEVCKDLLIADRVHFIAPADYSEGNILEKRIQLLLNSVIAEINFQKELTACYQEHNLSK